MGLRFGLMLCAMLAMTACDRKDDNAQQEQAATPPGIVTPAQLDGSASTQAPAPPPLAESWIGGWTGPEGTKLTIQNEPMVGYTVSITDLDGVRQFNATPVEGGLGFQRDGTRYVIHAGNGEQTGMKWLADKQNCLIVKTGEGFCR